MARCFTSRLRTTDFVARIGGEEFVALLVGTPADQARLFDVVRLQNKDKVGAAKSPEHRLHLCTVHPWPSTPPRNVVRTVSTGKPL